jgi:hypothetical protein
MLASQVCFLYSPNLDIAKIGSSIQWRARIKAHRRGFPFPLEVIHVEFNVNDGDEFRQRTVTPADHQAGLLGCPGPTGSTGHEARAWVGSHLVPLSIDTGPPNSTCLGVLPTARTEFRAADPLGWAVPRGPWSRDGLTSP